MTTSKTIAALLGPTLVASAISLLANLGTSRTIIEGLSQSPPLIMIAGYATFVPGPVTYLQLGASNIAARNDFDKRRRG